MLWIDNASHTWWNVVRGTVIPMSGAHITVQGLSAGAYTVEWWDTTSGARNRTESVTVGADGRLTFVVSNLTGDSAVKFSITAPSTPQQVTIPLYQGWNLVALPLAPLDPIPGAILAPIAGQYSAVFAYNACDSSDPWRKSDPSAPSFINDLSTIDIAQGLWIQVTADTTLTITGFIPAHTDIRLCPGANLIGYPVAAATPLPDALASIAGKYERVYAYDADDGTDPWKTFAPNTPAAANDLGAMSPGRGYWLHVTESAVLRLNAQLAASNAPRTTVSIDMAGWH